MMIQNKKSHLPKAGLDWLLQSEDPSLRFRVERDLLERKPNQLLQSQIANSKLISKIFAKMHPDGMWLHEGVGAGLDYSHGKTTHFILSYLAELGLDKSDPRIDKAVNRYLDLNIHEKWLSGPDHLTGQSCLYAQNIRTFVLLGYRRDPRVQERIATLQSEIRHDDGMLCRRLSYTQKTKSCIRGTLKALMAYAELPELWDSESCKRTVSYFLSRNVYFKKTNPTEKIRNGMATIFPFVIFCSLLEPLYALSKMGYGNHPALEDAWMELEKRNNGEGKYRLDWYTNSLFMPGKKGEINEWVTLYANLAFHYRVNSFSKANKCCSEAFIRNSKVVDTSSGRSLVRKS
jgi:hypothetical protein